MARIDRWAVALAVPLVLAACTTASGRSGGGLSPASPLTTVSLPPSGPGRESAVAVQARLCRRPPVPSPTPATPAPVPSALARVEHEVEVARELAYLHPVAVDAVTHAELVRGIDQSFNHSFPRAMTAARGRAWQAVGVIPRGTDLRQAYHRFLSSQIIGYYDPTTGQLVFIGTNNPSPTERLTLAHELTHADDDQHFDLSRINGLENHCQDEQEMAATGAVEGSAVFFSPGDISSILSQQVPPPTGVPIFLQRLLIWPYVDGPKFIAALKARGGLAEVNRALQDWPVSTEQVMHPSRYPSDVPARVEVPPLTSALRRAPDLDVMDVGEEWLKDMLSLRLAPGVAARVAAGWGGGQYRAWSVKGGVLVAMVTAWDTPADASQFAAALTRWLRPGQHALVALAGKDRVLALFATSGAALRAARSRR